LDQRWVVFLRGGLHGVLDDTGQPCYFSAFSCPELIEDWSDPDFI